MQTHAFRPDPGPPPRGANPVPDPTSTLSTGPPPPPEPAQLRSPFEPKDGQQLGPSPAASPDLRTNRPSTAQGRAADDEPSDIKENLAFWSSRSAAWTPKTAATPATTFVKLIARADILALPPIVSIDFVQRFFAYHVAAALVRLFQHNNHPLPDSLLARTRRLKLRLDTPWETLQANFLKARQLFISNREAGLPPDPSLRSYVVPFTDLEEIHQKAAKLREQARLEAQGHFDRLVPGRRGPAPPLIPPALLPSPATDPSRADSAAPTSHESLDGPPPTIPAPALPDDASAELGEPQHASAGPAEASSADQTPIPPVAPAALEPAPAHQAPDRSPSAPELEDADLAALAGLRGTYQDQQSPIQHGYRRQSLSAEISPNQESFPTAELLRRPIQPSYSGSPVGTLTTRAENYPLVSSSSTSPAVPGVHGPPEETGPPPLTELQLQARHSQELAALEQQYFRCVNQVEGQFNEYIRAQPDPLLRIRAAQLREQKLVDGKARYDQFMINTVARHRAEVQLNRLLDSSLSCSVKA
ncbi:hypothetical protein PtB15_2B380 [Puccinia triticina]|nr:hypothetical protein PtB15_2B380 [Puccinia triticina]